MTNVGFKKTGTMQSITTALCPSFFETDVRGPFKYYVIKEVGGWGLNMAIFDDLQYCRSSKRWVGLKKPKT